METSRTAYRGGRVKAGVHGQSRTSRRRLAATDAAARNRPCPTPAAPRKRRGWGRPIGIVVLVLLLVVVVWAVASYVVLGRAVDGANAGSARSARPAERAGPERADDDAPARHRPWAGRRPRERAPHGLDVADADRPRARTHRSSRCRATSASRCRARVLEAQRGLPVGGPDLTPHRSQPARERRRHPPRRGRRLRRLRAADRRARRGHDRRARADRLEPVRLPLLPRALRELERLALRRRGAEDDRAAGAGLLADPREQAQPGRERPPRGERRRCSARSAAS